MFQRRFQQFSGATARTCQALQLSRALLLHQQQRRKHALPDVRRPLAVVGEHELLEGVHELRAAQL